MIFVKPWKCKTVNEPCDATAAPAIDPINACDEELGIPKYHVNKFQKIAAKIAANTTTKPFVNLNGSTISFVIVPATPVNVKAPIKFIIAAKKIARLGVNALVDTAVATAFAVSWKPLIKSNTNEKITIATVIIII